MKTGIVSFVVALVLCVGGLLALFSAKRQRELAERSTQIVTFGAIQAEVKPGRIAALLQPADARSRMREQQALSEYWARDYKSLNLQRDSSGELVEKDPRIVLIAANAAYRQISLKSDKQAVTHELEEVMGLYAEVLKLDPGNHDAAYNYEFVARKRDALARAGATKNGGKTMDVLNPQLPPGRTILGLAGAPPEGSDMGQFKIIVPKRPDERQEAPEPGKGTHKVRKG